MANQSLFSSSKSTANVISPAIVTNEAGGTAYALSDKAALAKMALTGTLGNAFYTTAEHQLDAVLAYTTKLPTDYIAKVAVYARQNGFMKDMPALLLARVATLDHVLLKKVFHKVCDNAKMIRNFVQIIRSGKAGRKSLGTAPKKLIQSWLNDLTDKALLNASVGSSPSIADVIKLSHPKPKNDQRKAFYGHLIGKEIDKSALPLLLTELLDWRKNGGDKVPEVDFRLLTSSDLNEEQWAQIAKTASWQTTRQALNTFLRHGVFKSPELVNIVAAKLANQDLILRSKVMPYQLLTAFVNISPEMPQAIKSALEAALEVATQNIPSYNGPVEVLVDTSGSMQSSITGTRGSATSVTTCVQVAALIASCLLRKNPGTRVIPFDTVVHDASSLDPKNSIMSNAMKLAKFGGGGTHTSTALAELNKRGSTSKLVKIISDNESHCRSNYSGTAVMQQWELYRKRVPDAKLVCIDITPYTTTQAAERSDILNVFGFNDSVFEVVNKFTTGALGDDALVAEIESVTL